MTIGIDASGRAFRWNIGQGPEVGTDYLVMGCPPMDADEITLWSDPFSFRQQISSSGLPADLISIGLRWKELYGLTTDVFSSAAKDICAALKSDTRCPPRVAAATAFAIPNRLSEDAQDALLSALQSSGYANPVLLWRPIAIMLYWLHINHADTAVKIYSERRTAHIWVLDFEAPHLELTRLSWKPHTVDHTWISPVRSYPVPLPAQALNNKTISTAWTELFPDIRERNQLLLTQVGPKVQEHVESGKPEFDVWVCTDHRWRKIRVVMPERVPRACRELASEIKNHLVTQAATPPQPNDIVLVHGWLPRRFSSECLATIKERMHGAEVLLMPGDAIAQGAHFFADRYSQGLPTYYDKLPEYRIWTSSGWSVLVAQDQEVEPGKPWRLNDAAIMDAFAIARYRSDLSLLVQRQPISDAVSDFARRLKVSMKQMANTDIPIHLNAEVRPAQGSASFKVTAMQGARPFVYHVENLTDTASLSYGVFHDETTDGGHTTKEPEHKGYLEAQPVIGRIYDDPLGNIEMLKLLTDHCNDLEMAPAFHAVQASVKKFRIDHPPSDNFGSMPKCILAALARWGFEIKQPTRGLFGTKIIENRQISELSARLSAHLLEGIPAPKNNGPRNFWSKRQNYCHVFASNKYKTHIRNILSKPAEKFASWSEVYAPGYVLGEHPDDAQLLANYSIARNFDAAEDDYADKHFWAFFRMLCWHPEVHLRVDFVTSYLQQLSAFVITSHTLNVQTRKNACFALLFAMRVREIPGCERFLLDANDAPLLNSIVTLLSPGGPLAGVPFPKTMIPHLNGLTGTFSDYVKRFILMEDTVEDRELGSTIATSD